MSTKPEKGAAKVVFMDFQFRINRRERGSVELSFNGMVLGLVAAVVAPVAISITTSVAPTMEERADEDGMFASGRVLDWEAPEENEDDPEVSEAEGQSSSSSSSSSGLQVASSSGGGIQPMGSSSGGSLGGGGGGSCDGEDENGGVNPQPVNQSCALSDNLDSDNLDP